MLQAGVLVFIIIYFRPVLVGGVIMRLQFIPIILYYLVSAVFFISYIKFAKENGLVAEAIQRRKEAKKKRNDQQQK